MAEEHPRIHIVIITGYPSRESAEQAAEFGVFDYLKKPFNPGRLSAATAEVLAHPPRYGVSAFNESTHFDPE